MPEAEGGNSIRHCFSSEEWRKIQQSNPMYLLLAKIQVREHTNVKDVVVMDARVRGGELARSYPLKSLITRLKADNAIGILGTGMEKRFIETVSLLFHYHEQY
ncbi:hypothetical protein AAAC51_07590 [Priestia megaterium]